MRYEPWGLLGKFHGIDRLFDEVWGDVKIRFDDSATINRRWSPTIDSQEGSDRFLLSADIPGVDPKDLEITVEPGVLTIQGERLREDTDEKDGYRHLERAHGRFYRRVALSDDADTDRISATAKNGVLQVIVPKKEAAQPRRIAVH
jgi:HSP20 family protein